MRIKLIEDKTLEELTVSIQYSQITNEVRQIEKLLKSLGKVLTGSDNGRTYQIPVSDIFYIESVDRKTFIYTKDKVFRSELKLYDLQDELLSSEFVRISKSTILNINVLESISTLINSKLETVLSNGEKLWVSRTYIPDIKRLLFRGDEQ
ncbi:LytTR family DNA-binding domain-containing protein [Oscillospiraceae bacterium PP1C4]